MRRWLVSALFVLCVSPLAGAHTMMMTQVLVSFGHPDAVDVKIDVDLTLLLGSPERYYEVATESPGRQQEDLKRVVPKVTENLQLFVGQQRLQLVFRGFSAAKAQQADYLDASMSKLSTLNFVAALPAVTEPLKLVVPIGAEVDYPVAYTVQIPSAHLSVTRWVEEGVHESDPFVWAGKVPKAPEGAPGAAHASPPSSAQLSPSTICPESVATCVSHQRCLQVSISEKSALGPIPPSGRSTTESRCPTSRLLSSIATTAAAPPSPGPTSSARPAPNGRPQ